MGAPPLSSVDIGPLSKVLPSKEGRRLHRSVIRIGHKIVAHAESRYFPVRIVATFLPPSSGQMDDGRGASELTSHGRDSVASAGSLLTGGPAANPSRTGRMAASYLLSDCYFEW